MPVPVPALLLLVALAACEPLRPEVVEPLDDGPSTDLALALRLSADDAPRSRITPALKRAIERAVDPDEVERARRLLVQQWAEWFQLAHLARDLLESLEGHERAFNRLQADLDAEVPPRPRRSPPAVSGIDAIAALLTTDSDPGRLVDTRRRLNQRLLELERAADAKTRTAVAATRRFLTLEAGWRYVHEWSASASRVEELVGFLDRPETAGLRDNAWLMLRLGFALGLQKPRVPRRPLLDAAAILFGEARDRKPAHDVLIRLGKGRGDSLPEQLHSAWHGLHRRLADTLDRRDNIEPSDDGRRTFTTLAAHLKIQAPGRATAETLYGFGEPLRREAVARWSLALELLPMHDPRAPGQVQETARKLAAQKGRLDAMWVMTLLALQEAVARRLGDAVRGRAIRLRATGPFVERSLILPKGVVVPAFPKKVRACLEPPTVAPDCMGALVTAIVEKARGSNSRPR